MIQSIWIGFRGDYFRTAAPVKANTKATTFTVNWNCKNFLMESKIFLPHFIAVTIDLKLSSRRIIPAAYLATYVPAIPIANPMSAFFKAGASFVPSPVIATTWSNCLSPVAIIYLSVGEERAKTLRLAATFLKFSILPTLYSCVPWFLIPPTKALKSFPSITVLSSSPLLCQSFGRIPAYLAIATAVFWLSPVIIRTVTPAVWQV